MHVGVVIPAYNSAAYLEQAVESVRAQTFSNWSCVIVDDGSPDSSGAIADRCAAQDPRISVLHQESAGVMAARNAGAAALSKAESLLFLDGDDRLLPEGLERLTSALDRTPASAGAVGGLILVDAADRELGQVLVGPAPVALEEIATQNPCPAPCGFLVRRPAFLRAGGFPSGYSYAGDWHLFTLVCRDGPLAVVTEPVAAYRRHSGAATSSEKLNSHGHREIRRTRIDVYRYPSDSRTDRRALRRGWRRYNLSRAREHAHSFSGRRTLGHVLLAAIGRPVDLSHF